MRHRLQILNSSADRHDSFARIEHAIAAIRAGKMVIVADNPRKLVAIEGYGLSVTEWLPLEIPASPSSLRYLTTKRNKLDHRLRAL